MNAAGTQLSEETGDEGEGRIRGWQRVPRNESVTLRLPEATEKPLEQVVPGSGGLLLSVTVRPMNVPAGAAGLVPPGVRSVSVFLVNQRPVHDGPRHEGWIFQAWLETSVAEGFIARPDFRGFLASDFDERVADLQYRGDCEMAVGHGVAAEAVVEDDRRCRRVRTEWIPEAPVEWVAPAEIEGVELGMEALAAAESAEDLRALLAPLPQQYRSWIEQQGRDLGNLPGRRKETAKELLTHAGVAAGRIEKGVAHLADPLVLEAFRIANRTMAIVQRRRQGADRGIGPEQVPTPRWRPFQLAFLLMNLPGIADSSAEDRGKVDLLFFPTGGGKTEAYLGLAAFALVLLRLRNAGIASAGVTVLMRYTLRPLTIDQLGRAAALMCALELERERDPERLGTWPFEIGLWVGRSATPNVVGHSGDGNEHSARARTLRFQRDSKRGSPIPLEDCPWCGRKLEP